MADQPYGIQFIVARAAEQTVELNQLRSQLSALREENERLRKIWPPVNRAFLVPFHRSESCRGEQCALCGADADLKIGEEIMHDDPWQNRHNLTAYVCLECGNRLFFSYLFRSVRDPAVFPPPLDRERSNGA